LTASGCGPAQHFAFAHGQQTVLLGETGIEDAPCSAETRGADQVDRDSRLRIRSYLMPAERDRVFQTAMAEQEYLDAADAVRLPVL
jgi:hypothetical protein